LDKGVDGFRIDAVPHLFERLDLLDVPVLSNETRLDKVGYSEGLDECFSEVYDWRSLLDEYKKKDGQTRYKIYAKILSRKLIDSNLDWFNIQFTD